MDEEEDDLGLIGKIMVITLLVLLVLFALTVVIGGFFFGFLGFFHLFGVEYDSIGSVVLFVVFSFLLGIVVDLVPGALYRIYAPRMQGKYKIATVQIAVDTVFSWITLFTIDEFMNSITIPLATEIAAALLLALMEIVFDDKGKKGKLA